MSEPSVLFIDHAGVLGGAELYLLDVARPFNESSHVVLFEDGPFVARLREANISVEVLSAPSAFLDVKKSGAARATVAALPGLVSLAVQVARRATDYHVLFANSQKSLLVAGLAGALAGRPVVWNLHDLLTADHFSRVNRTIAVLFANYCTNRVIVNSRATREAFSRSGGHKEKTEIVYNGIDPAPFDQIDTGRVSLLRRGLNVPDRAPLVGLFGRLAPWKGQHVLIDALPMVPETHALLVGDALFRGDASYEVALRRRAKHRGVSDRVHFLGFRSDIPHLMRLVDIVLHTSVAPEPFGRVIVEGMLAAKPVIATRGGGATEVVREPDTGILIPGDEPNVLAEAIQATLNAPDRAEAMGRAAREYAKERFGIQQMQSTVRRIIVETARRPE